MEQGSEIHVSIPKWSDFSDGVVATCFGVFWFQSQNGLILVYFHLLHLSVFFKFQSQNGLILVVRRIRTF